MLGVKEVVIVVAISICLAESFTFVDLTHGLVNFGVPVVIDDVTVFRYTKMAQGNSQGTLFRYNDYLTGEHCGSHMDAPYHLIDSGRTIDEIPIERFITTGILVNATAETGNNPNYTLPVEKLQNWEAENGPFPDPCVVLVDFGWHRFYGDNELFVGPLPDDPQNPGLSKEAAEYLIQTKKVYGVGVDTVAVDIGLELIIHTTLLGNDIYILETLDLSTPLPPIFNLAALPLKLVNGTGAQARVIAWY
ncbi:isatin hydrolase-like isoform X1 [Rhodnius prolixus]|uniref:isatin hydrolase-like isoform X1 n=2 Tax=Rhodnius prolixus TaxID=13249 RepID=UPI003D189573